MPFTIPVLKMTFGGSLPGNEIWQCGLWISPTSLPATQAQLQSASDALIPAVTAFFNSTSVTPLEAQGMTVNNLSLYRYPAGATKSDLVAHSIISLPGVSTSPKLPNQCALVTTLRTVNPGRNGRGRFYFPIPGGVPSAAGQLVASTVTNFASAVETFIQTINGGPAPSPQRVVGGTSGFAVTAISVDSIVDTQRRRRNKLIASTTATVPVP
jgi:hypothetical protein